MSNAHADDTKMIESTIQHYINGAKSGKGDDMKPAFHEDATIFGYIGDDLFAGPIKKLFDWNDENGPAIDLVAKITNIDIEGSMPIRLMQVNTWKIDLAYRRLPSPSVGVGVVGLQGLL